MNELKYRGVLICNNPQCEEFQKQTFALLTGKERAMPLLCLGHTGKSTAYEYAPKCGQKRELLLENEFYTLGTKLFRQVRVDWEYDVIERRYRNVAIVTDESLPQNAGIYTLQTPLVKTEKRALIVAENILSNLQRQHAAIESARVSAETVLRFDNSKEVFEEQLNRLSSILTESTLALAQAGVRVA